MHSDLNQFKADALLLDWLAEAERYRRTRVNGAEPADSHETVTVRLARPADVGAVVRLSQFEGRPAPATPTLVAEVGGAVVAARSLEDGAAVADPFRPTGQLMELLELRAAQLRDAARDGSHHGRRLRPWGRFRRARLQGQ